MKRKMIAPWVRLVREPHLTPLDGVRVRSPEDVKRALADHFAAEEVEQFVVLSLDAQSRVRAITQVSKGILNASLVHPRETFRVAIAMGAAGIIVAHNHPSGDPEPSADDRAVARQLLAAGELLDITLYDCVIFAGDKFVSFATRGLL